jgi:hypothetical protein
MFWWFERKGSYARCEVLELPSGGYELRVINPEGNERVEYFDDANELASRQRAVEEGLTSDGWTGPHGVVW